MLLLSELIVDASTCLVNIFPFTSDPVNELLGTGQKKGNCVRLVVVCGADLGLWHILQGL